MTMNPERVVFGPAYDMRTEYAIPEYIKGKWIVSLIGNGMWDAEGFETYEFAKAEAEYLAATYGIKVERV